MSMNDDMKDLLHEYYDEMLRCTRCGFCQAACPTYDMLRRESATARGKVQLLRAVSQGDLPMSEAISRYLYTCLGCRSCLQHCPGAVRTHEIFAIARKAFAQTEFLPAALTELDGRVDAEHNISGEDNESRLLWQDNLKEKPAGLWARPGRRCCSTSAAWPACTRWPTPFPQSMVDILEAAKVDYHHPGRHRMVLRLSADGGRASTDDLIEHNLAEIERLGVKRLVATCPSCYYTWTNYYPRTGLQDHARDAIPGRARRKWAAAAGGSEARVTYHDPCDLGRKSKEYDAPRRMLKAIPGVELVEMANNRAAALCCGGGGNQESLNPELSAGVADVRLAEAIGTGASIVVSACQQCERTLTMAARRAKARIKVMDVTELVRRSLQG